MLTISHTKEFQNNGKDFRRILTLQIPKRMKMGLKIGHEKNNDDIELSPLKRMAAYLNVEKVKDFDTYPN